MADKPGSVVHIEFHSSDPARTKEFYAKVFGWKFQEMPEMNYALFQAPSGPGGGLQKASDNEMPGIWNYILSREIDETARNIQAAGGTLLIPKSEIPGFGWWAAFRDPTGLTMALYQPMARPAPARRARAARKSSSRGRKGRKRSR